MDSQVTKIRISQAYLELARSYMTAYATSTVTDVANPTNLDESNRATAMFGFAALSTVFSYAAIEAFVNHELYHIWKDAREAHEIIERIQKANPSRNYVPIFHSFHQKYGRYFSFNKLKSTDLRELTERIKTICKAQNLPSIPETNDKLWKNLLRLEETRHQLIHPTPEEAEFDKLINKLFSDEPYALYPQTAADIIRFFFQSTKGPVPDYLDDNKLFRIKSIEIL
jgi:hypothetical protein